MLPPARHFVLLTSSGKAVGRYIGSTPVAAARKVGNRLMKHMKTTSSRNLVVKEVTVGSAKKTFSYVVRRVKLTHKKVIIRDGKRITYGFKVVATRKQSGKPKKAKKTVKKRKTLRKKD